MCYPPLSTGMERIKVLTALRSSEIKLPGDFDERLLMQQVHIIRWLLDHDPTKRPNSQELLSSDYLPPPQVKPIKKFVVSVYLTHSLQVEEAELKELVRHTLTNAKSSAYRHLVEACLGQKMSLAQDISYDLESLRDLTKKPNSGGGTRSVRRALLAHEHVRCAAEAVFRRHGAVHVQLGHLLPARDAISAYDRPGAAAVEVMTKGGRVVRLPYDLRVGFARFLARSKITSLRRYCIAPVSIPTYYRSCKMNLRKASAMYHS